ncbi:MAG: DUF1631 domain-containing protein [Lysobacter sp.]|nr:DUF1631 domain-containing protein [Lysobacter sp.]
MAAPTDPQDHTAPRTLASAGLPRRVRRTLERALALFSEELERNLVTTVTEFEEELFRLADRIGTIGGGSTDYMHTLRIVRLNRHDLVPRFMQVVETGLAGIRKPMLFSATSRPATTPAPMVNFRNLSLVDESVMDEGAVLHAIASRQESRANLVLHLLGQRFGVLAAAPAFDSERIPLGPQALCRAIRHATESVQLDHGARLLFYRIFDRRVMIQCLGLAEKLDALLVEEGVLPGLTYVPMRTRAAGAGGGDSDTDNDEDGENEDPAEGAGAGKSTQGARPGGVQGGGPRGGAPQAQGGGPQARGQPGAQSWMSGSGSPGGQLAGSDDAGAYADEGSNDPNRPFTTWMGQPMPSAAVANEQAAYHDLQQLLSRRRAEAERHNPIPPNQRPERTIVTRDLLQTLGRMDAEPMSGGNVPDIEDIKQSLLAQARQQYGKPVALAPSDSDTFDLVGLLYSHLQREIRDDAPAAALVKRMQLTLLRVALQDRAFFVRPNHPARQLLSTVSETAAKWLADDDFDPQLLAPLQQAVTHAVKNYDGNLEVFEQSNKQLQAHIDTQVRRAETLEKRHVEAARGKEKLEAAKLRAEQVLTEIIGEAPLPRFTRALLNQAWADVLTLTFLRHGEGSEEWNRQIDATRQIIAACTDRDPNAEHPALKAHVESALKQVGYHEDEAEVIAKRLSSNVRDEEDGESRTELTMKLKARVRLGEDSQKARKPDLPARSPHEQECYEQLRLLPFGTWMEFVTNQQGDVVRRRMSWFSPVTDNALFVNQRGQRIGEHSLDSLARMMAKDQVRIVTVQRAGLVDRAWSAAMNALRALTGHREEHPEDEPGEAAAQADIAVRSGPAAPIDATVTAPEGTFVRSVPSTEPGNPRAVPYPGLIGDESAGLPPKGSA